MSYVFALDKDQIARFEKWGQAQINKSPNARAADSFGFRFQFVFGPTGIGDNVHVIDARTKETIDLTVGDDGEFVFTEEEATKVHK